MSTPIHAVKLTIWIGLALTCPSVTVGVAHASAECPSPDLILQRYVAALGGENALRQIKTIIVKARESEPHTFNPQSTAYYRYTFKWKVPDKVVAKPRRLLDFPDWRFDGESWSNFDGRLSHNDDSEPLWRIKLKGDYPYNDNPQYMMYRITAAPILVAIAKNLYDDFETGNDADPLVPGTCVLLATGTNQWRTRRQDRLYFDSRTGFLKTWKIQAGRPGHLSYFRFDFKDYRVVNAIKVPFYVYFDFYGATFRFTKVTLNAPLTDAEFVPKK